MIPVKVCPSIDCFLVRALCQSSQSLWAGIQLSFLDVKLMAIDDIDGLHQDPVRIHFIGGSCDTSAHWRHVELLLPCYGSAPPSLLCPCVSLSICLFLSMYPLPEKGGGVRRRKGESDGELNNIIISSSRQNLSCSESNPTMAELHCIKGVSRVADATSWTRDGII